MYIRVYKYKKVASDYEAPIVGIHWSGIQKDIAVN